MNKCSKLDVFPMHSHVSPIRLCSLWSPAEQKMNTVLVREQIKIGVFSAHEEREVGTDFTSSMNSTFLAAKIFESPDVH